MKSIYELFDKPILVNCINCEDPLQNDEKDFCIRCYSARLAVEILEEKDETIRNLRRQLEAMGAE